MSYPFWVAFLALLIFEKRATAAEVDFGRLDHLISVQKARVEFACKGKGKSSARASQAISTMDQLGRELSELRGRMEAVGDQVNEDPQTIVRNAVRHEQSRITQALFDLDADRHARQVRLSRGPASTPLTLDRAISAHRRELADARKRKDALLRGPEDAQKLIFKVTTERLHALARMKKYSDDIEKINRKIGDCYLVAIGGNWLISPATLEAAVQGFLPARSLQREAGYFNGHQDGTAYSSLADGASAR